MYTKWLPTLVFGLAMGITPKKLGFGKEFLHPTKAIEAIKNMKKQEEVITQ